MQAILWISGLILVASLLFLVVFFMAVKKGGKKVELVNPVDLILFPKKEDEDVSPGFLERFIRLEGAANFRDIGGYLTRTGRQVRTGKIFRSDELSELSDVDLTILDRLGMRRILDLRSREEVKKKADRIPENGPFEYIHIPVYEKEPRWDYLPAILFKRHKLGEVLSARYFDMIEKRAEVFGKIVASFADLKNLPAVYHCNAGKDRTGIVTALVLSILGVPDETIIADYSLSNLGFDHYFGEFVEDSRHAPLGVADEEFQGLFIAQPDWMKNLLAHLNQSYGSVEAYLIKKGKVPPGVLERVRLNLLV